MAVRWYRMGQKQSPLRRVVFQRFYLDRKNRNTPDQQISTYRKNLIQQLSSAHTITQRDFNLIFDVDTTARIDQATRTSIYKLHGRISHGDAYEFRNAINYLSKDFPLLAINTYKLMRQNSLELDLLSFEKVLESCAIVKDLDHGMQVWGDLLRTNVENEEHFRNGTEEFSPTSNYKHQKYDPTDIRPISRIYENLSNLFGRCGQLQRLQALYREMYRLHGKSQAELQHLKPLLFREHNYVFLFGDITPSYQDSIAPNAQFWNTVLFSAGFCRDSNGAAPNFILDTLGQLSKTKNLIMSKRMWASALLNLARSNEHCRFVHGLVAVCKEKGMMSAAAVVAIIEAEARQGKFEKGMQYYNQMKAKDFPNCGVYFFNQVLEACTIPRDKEVANMVLEDMIRMQLRPSMKTYVSLLISGIPTDPANASPIEQHEMREHALKVITSMRLNGVRPSKDIQHLLVQIRGNKQVDNDAFL
eukprot:TRINITY_DN10643_c0_g1_i1.p1 TRINITY_DN10643_c0_g1~~TRINITY_DN10643_c0_g1_i1.p1  ORF type:complete len:526 (-),score=53.63 TRINITY_DN10643_c0_g1_i1:1034-2452(-)